MNLENKYQKLFQPIKINQLEVKNRIFMSPMSTNFATKDGYVTDEMIYYYSRRAKGGVGLIVTEVTMIEPTYKYIAHTLSIQDDSYLEGWQKLANEIHKYDSKVVAQLLHPAYMAIPFPETPQLVGPSEVGPYYAKTPPRPLTKEEISIIVEQFGDGALRLKKAGIDGVEIHAAHAHAVLGGFLSPLYNKRIDEYGGDITHRIRLLLEVIANVRKKCGRDFAIIVRISGDDYEAGGQSLHEGCYIAKRLEAAQVDMIHVGQANHTGNMNDTIPAMGTQPYCFMNKYTKQIKDVVTIPVSSVGRILTPQNGESLIDNGICDIIGLGRSLLADPDYVKKLKNNEAARIRHCMMCNKGCTDAIQNRQFLSCVLNAENGYEYKRIITPAATKKKIVVVGGGAAGLEAARVAKTKGHDVILFEQDTRLGGQLNIAAIPPRKAEMNRAINYLSNEMKILNVDLRLGKKATSTDILNEHPDSVIIAVGANNASLPIPGSDLTHVLDAWKVLNYEQFPSGHVAIIGGGLVGAETAEFLAQMGLDVTVIEMLEEIAKEESSTVKPVMFEDFEKHQVKLLTKTKVIEIKNDCIKAANGDGELTIPCDYVILATGAKPNPFDVSELTAHNIDIHLVGDCNEKAADINNAITQGYLAANSI